MSPETLIAHPASTRETVRGTREIQIISPPNSLPAMS